MSQSSRFLTIFGLTLSIALGTVYGFNRYIDPLAIHDHAHYYNRYHVNQNERERKTMHVLHGDSAETYDALLLGSSRTCWIDQREFPGMKVYNYAVSGMLPEEYVYYADAFSSRYGTPETIILGLDFFGAASREPVKHDPRLYVSQTSRFRVLEKMICYDTLRNSYRDFRFNATHAVPTDNAIYYDRENNRQSGPRSEERRAKAAPWEVRLYARTRYAPASRYNEDWLETLQALREKYPDARFLVFTTPISIELYQTLVDCGRFEDYCRFITEAVEVFGEVRDLMGRNDFTTDPTRYFDAHHFTPEAGRWLVHEALLRSEPRIGRRVHAGNLQAHLQAQRADMQPASPDSGSPELLAGPSVGKPSVIRLASQRKLESDDHGSEPTDGKSPAER